MIYTSSYDACKNTLYATCSISADRGKRKAYTGNYYRDLAPKKDFWIIWHDNIGKISEEENNKFYIREYWSKVLSRLDAKKVYQDLDNCILLCYEDNTKFCHRLIVAAWFELLLGVTVDEVVSNGLMIEHVDKPLYNFIKAYLKELMHKDGVI